MSEFLSGDLQKAISALEGFLQGSDSQTSLAALLAVSYLLTGKTDEALTSPSPGRQERIQYAFTICSRCPSH